MYPYSLSSLGNTQDMCGSHIVLVYSELKASISPAIKSSFLLSSIIHSDLQRLMNFTLVDEVIKWWMGARNYTESTEDPDLPSSRVWLSADFSRYIIAVPYFSVVRLKKKKKKNFLGSVLQARICIATEAVWIGGLRPHIGPHHNAHTNPSKQCMSHLYSMSELELRALNPIRSWLNDQLCYLLHWKNGTESVIVSQSVTQIRESHFPERVKAVENQCFWVRDG